MIDRFTALIVVTSAALLVGCGSRADPSAFGLPQEPLTVVCGPGTVLVGDECLPAATDGSSEGSSGGNENDDAGSSWTGSYDAGTVATEDANVPFVGRDAGPASSFAVDPAHDDALAVAAVSSPLTAAWTSRFTGPISYPVVADDLVIVAAAEAQANVRAFNLATGALVWGPVLVGGETLLAVEGDELFALDGAGNLRAMNAQTGGTIWSTQLVGQIDFDAPPVAFGGLVYVNGLESGGTTYAVDEETGNVVWSADTLDGTFGAVAIGGGAVYEAEACQQVSSFNPVTGALNWLHQTSCSGGGGAAPSFYQGQLWVRDETLGNVILDTSGNVAGSFEATAVPAFNAGTAFYLNASTLSAVTIQSGELKWTFAGDGQLCTSAVVAAGGGQVFVGSQSGNVYELDDATGLQTSAASVGTTVSCSTETQSMGLASGHLIVPAGTTLVVY